MTKQPKLFDDTNTLPLFSGTAPRAKLSPFEPTPGAQPSLPFECKTCRDTGTIISDRLTFCWCEAGQQARKDKIR